jgi:flagellar basal-body rod protein FlgB
MIDSLTNAGSIPALEKLMQFSGQRHRILSHNIANLSTPDFRPVDVSPGEFQKSLAEAIDERRAVGRGVSGDLRVQDSPQVTFQHGRIMLHPEPTGDNAHFHDGSERDLDRSMQALVENFMAFRTAVQFMRKQFESLHIAIRERM